MPGRGAPTISVVTPTLNVERFIAYNMASVSKQTYQPIDHIIVDGGSTDKTLEYVDIYRRHYKDSTSCIVLDRPKSTFVEALNMGIEKASGDIVVIQNADDLVYDAHVFWKVRDFFEGSPDVAILFGEIKQFRGHEIIWDSLKANYGSKYIFSDLLQSKFTIPQGSAFFNRELALETGLMHEDISTNNEWQLWLNMAYRGDVCYIPAILSYYRVVEGQLSFGKLPGYRKKILDRFFDNMRGSYLNGKPIEAFKKCAYNGAARFEYMHYRNKPDWLGFLLRRPITKQLITTYIKRRYW